MVKGYESVLTAISKAEVAVKSAKNEARFLLDYMERIERDLLDTRTLILSECLKEKEAKNED